MNPPLSQERTVIAENPRTPSIVPEGEVVPSPGLTPDRVEASNPSSDVKPHLDFLWNAHKYQNDYIRFADTKAAFTVALASTIMGALFTAKLHELFILAAPKQWTLISWLAAGAFLALGASIACGVWTIRPRLSHKQPKGFLYWGAVAEHGSPETFWSGLKAQSLDGLGEHVAHHVFALSRLAGRKYFWVSLAMTFGAVGGLFATLALLFK